MQYNESARLRAVKIFKQLVSDKDKEFQHIVALAAEICQTPIAFISLLDDKTTWFKTKVGVAVPQIPRDSSFCQYAILSDNVFEVQDAFEDSRFSNKTFMVSDTKIRFYAASPICTDDGHKIGTLGVMGSEPGKLTEIQKKTLELLSYQAVALLNAQYRENLLKVKIEALKRQNDIFKKMAQAQSHEIHGPVATIMGIVGLIKDEGYVASKDYLLHLEQAANTLDDKIHEIARHSQLGIDAYLENVSI